MTLREVVAVLERFYPPESAQSWDRVGLVAGDLDQPVRRVHAAVDPTLAVIDEARDLGADLLLTHHPLLMRGVHSVATTTAKGASVTSLVVGDVALYVAHTNADVGVPGVNSALAAACGLTRWEPLAVEAPFEVELGRVRLRGSIDRVEGDATGLRVVDLKTGRSAKTAAQAEQDLQLASYQAAIREGALAEQLGEDAPERLNGAQLVYLGTGGRSAAVRTQTALPRAEDPAWFDELVQQVSTEVSGTRVTARVNSHCTRCAVRSSCPLQPEGDQL